jgi:hypothetical protein
MEPDAHDGDGFSTSSTLLPHRAEALALYALEHHIERKLVFLQFHSSRFVEFADIFFAECTVSDDALDCGVNLAMPFGSFQEVHYDEVSSRMKELR